MKSNILHFWKKSGSAARLAGGIVWKKLRAIKVRKENDLGKVFFAFIQKEKSLTVYLSKGKKVRMSIYQKEKVWLSFYEKEKNLTLFC